MVFGFDAAPVPPNQWNPNPSHVYSEEMGGKLKSEKIVLGKKIKKKN